jgi:3'-5' exoribonuclease
MGVAYIDKKCKELNIDEETTLLIKHMILSHHGEPDFGSAVRPMFLEAILLNVIDNIDAKVYMCQEALDNTEVGSFTDRIYGMENIQLYKHGLKNDEEYRNY